MASRYVGDITPRPDDNRTTELAIFDPDKIAPISCRLDERGKTTPEADYFQHPEQVALQRLAHTDHDLSSARKLAEESGIQLMGDGYDIGIVGNDKADKLIIALSKCVDRQERIVNTSSKGIISLLGDKETQEAIIKTFGEIIPIIINRVEFAKVYFGKKRIGGAEVEHITKLLLELSQKRYFRKEDNGIIISQLLYIPNLPIIENNGSTPFVVLLNKDFARCKQFIPYPSNYLKLFQKAKHIDHQLFALLALHATKYKKSNREAACILRITEKELWKIIASEKKYTNRPKRRKEDFDKAVINITSMGLIVKCEHSITDAGEAVIIFELNKNYVI